MGQRDEERGAPMWPDQKLETLLTFVLADHRFCPRSDRLKTVLGVRARYQTIYVVGNRRCRWCLQVCGQVNH
jgi:hypothetical protein